MNNSICSLSDDINFTIIKNVQKGEWFYVALVSTKLHCLVLKLKKGERNFEPSIEFAVSSVERITWILGVFEPTPKWLGHQLSNETEDGLIWAIRKGNLSVLQKLCNIIHKDSGDSYCDDGIDNNLSVKEFCARFAASFGKIEILEWLVNEDKHSEKWKGVELCVCAAIDKSTKGLAWVYKYEYIGDVNKTFESAAECGNLKGLKWLFFRENPPSTSTTFEKAIKSGNLAMLDWIMKTNALEEEDGFQEPFPIDRTECTYSTALDAVLDYNANDCDNVEYVLCIFEWLWKNDFEMNENEGLYTIHEAARKGYLRILQWIEKKQFDWWTLKAMELNSLMTIGFTENKHIHGLQWLNDNNRLNLSLKQWLEAIYGFHNGFT